MFDVSMEFDDKYEKCVDEHEIEAFGLHANILDAESDDSDGGR